MGNKIRIKQIDLQGIFSASGQVDILSASNYASFVTQLDTTMSSDAELSAVSSSISQSIYTINQVIGSGLVSGSSQISILGFATTGSNTFTGDITLVSSSNIILRGPGDDGYSGAGDLIFQDGGGNETARLWKAADSNRLVVSFTGSHNSYIFGTLIHSLNLKEFGDDHFILTSSFNQFTESIDSRVDSLEAVTSSYLTSLDGAISGAGQISDLGFVTGSYAFLTEFNSLTQSFNIISGSVVNITNAVDVVQLNNTTASLNNFTSSYYTDSSSFDSRITTEKGRIDSILSASTADVDTFTEIVNLINSVDLTNDNAFATFYTASNARLSSIENATGSYLTSLNGAISSSSQLTSSYDTRYTLSGSVQPLPNGLISGSSQLTSSYDTRYTLSGSVVNSNINTGSFATTGSNSFNGNQTITGSLVVSSVAVVSGGLTIPTGSVITLTSGSSIFVDSSGAITGSLTGSVFGIGDVTAFSSSVNSRINSITSSAIPAGTVSGSSQLTSSFDTRYTLSGSVQPLPSGLISGSSQLTSSYDTRYAPSASYLTSLNGAISGSSQLTSSYDSRYSLSGSVLTSFSSSVDNRLDTLEATIISGSVNYVQTLGARVTGVTSTGVTIITGSITTTGNAVQIMVTGDANPIGGTAWTRLQIYRNETAIGNVVQVENTSNLNVPYCLNVIDTPSAGTYTYSMRPVSGFAGTFDFGEHTGPTLTAVELKSQTSFQGITLISGSSQLTSSFDTRYTLSGSVQPLPNGLISGSSQLTASYDTRYTLSGSVVSGTTSAGTISGSAQLTSSFDGRYVQTGSFNSLTASFNSFTASAQSVTTGSNSFNGTQTITGSLIITTGSFVASQILANTASLYLTSGSNMYVQNNGVVEITGSLRVSGSAAFNVNVLSVDGRNGDEGGEINLAIPVTNTTLQNRVNVDIWQNRLRIFEGSAGANGVFIDLSKPTGNNNEITYKASGLVNAGDFVQLDNIKATITTTGNRGLSLATVSGTFVCNIAGNYAGAVVGVSGTSGTATITTSASTSIFGWGFTTQGDIATYIITDTTNSRAYRITIQIGGSYLNNLVSIERLH